MSTDLFGSSIPEQPATGEATPDRITNDIEEVVTVLRLAAREGYAVVGGARQQVWRLRIDPVVEPVPRHEADTVRQLLDAGWLTLGGAHRYEHRDLDLGGHSVLVPRRSRQWLQRWDSRKRLGTPGGSRP